MYQKIQADHIFDGYRMLPSDQVLILDESGKVVEFVSSIDAGDDIRMMNGIVCPGFINCHCHIELSHLKGLIPEKTGLIGFIGEVMKNRQADVETIAVAAANAIEEMRSNGIVAVGDICNNASTIDVKIGSSLYYHNFIEVSGFSESIAEKRLAQMQQVLDAFEATGMKKTLVPHAPYSVGKRLLAMIVAANQQNPMTIHNQETIEENELFISGTGEFLEFYRQFSIATDGFSPSGKSSWQTLLPSFSASNPLILVHNVHTAADDIDQSLMHYREYPENLYLCLCPNANQYISGQLPEIDMMLQKNLQLVLGTDSLASNHQLDLMAEMITLKEKHPQLQWEQMLQWATINGAKALQIDHQYGSFEKGKRPGFVVLHNKKVMNM